MQVDERIRPVLLSGGAGSRLWPLSRRARPKQLTPLGGTEPMIVATARRVEDPARFAPAIIVAGADHGRALAMTLSAAGIVPHALLVEPEGRNTAPAIALAAHCALAEAADPLLLVMPSDHVVADLPAFHAAIARAVPAAREGALVTFGIAADRPETGYGYIERGPAAGEGVFRAARFVEKPDAATAATYLASGRFDWNAGIFLFRASALMDALGAHAADIAGAVASAWAARRAGEDGTIVPGADAWATCPAQSIDYAVMEQAADVRVVPVAMGWSDVGAWDALAALTAPDAGGNAISGDVVALDAQRCLLRSEGPLVAAIGITDLCVVATPDAVLVVPRERAQEVRRIVDELKRTGRAALL